MGGEKFPKAFEGHGRQGGVTVWDLRGDEAIPIKLKDWRPTPWELRRVAVTSVGKYTVSTVRLDPCYHPDRMFQTVVVSRDPVKDGQPTRFLKHCRTMAQAIRQHEEQVVAIGKKKP